MYYIIILLLIIKTQAIIRLGRIENTRWILNSSQIGNQYINISNITCEQCLCQMIKMNNIMTSLACQSNAMTCQLIFSNVTVQLRIDMNSIVYLRKIPQLIQTTTSMSLRGKHRIFYTTQILFRLICRCLHRYKKKSIENQICEVI